MDLSKEEENRAMRVYLGGEEAARYEPTGRERRLRAAYGADWRKVQAALDEYLRVLIARPEGWDRGAAPEAAAQVDAVIAGCFPWFDETARALMVGCFLHEWR